MTLNPKQQLFVLEYLKDMNATQAAIRAGYSEKTAGQQGARMLKNVKIAEALAKAIEERNKEVKIDAAWVLKRAVEVHDRCMQAEPVTQMIDGEIVETGQYKFEHSGANKALEIIGRHVDVQAFKDQMDLNITDRAEAIARARERAKDRE